MLAKRPRSNWTYFSLFDLLSPSPKLNTHPLPQKKTALLVSGPILVSFFFFLLNKTSSVLPFKLSSINSQWRRNQRAYSGNRKPPCRPDTSNISWDYSTTKSCDVVPSGSCQRHVVRRWPQFPLLSVRPSSQAPCLIPCTSNSPRFAPGAPGLEPMASIAVFLFQCFFLNKEWLRVGIADQKETAKCHQHYIICTITCQHWSP